MTAGILMIDIDGTTLSDDDVSLLQNPEIGGLILFKRNVESPAQIRTLTDSIRTINPNILIATDQEGGRVARFRDGFSPLPAMGKLGEVYEKDQKLGLSLAYDTGYLMATEVLAVGVDFSFAPVLDIDDCSLVIKDRAFSKDKKAINALAGEFISGMNDAGMKATGKHFPGHGSVAPDSHTSDAIDERPFDEIWTNDMATFSHNLQKLSAIMPAHVIFSQIDNKPAGFSSIWLQDILRDKMGFNGVIFSDDLSMKAAHIAGGVKKRVASAITAGCDMALVCNDRSSAILALEFAKTLPKPTVNRFETMRGNIPTWQGDLVATCQTFSYWQTAKANVEKAFFSQAATDPITEKDPTAYQIQS